MTSGTTRGDVLWLIDVCKPHPIPRMELQPPSFHLVLESGISSGSSCRRNGPGGRGIVLDWQCWKEEEFQHWWLTVLHFQASCLQAAQWCALSHESFQVLHTDHRLFKTNYRYFVYEAFIWFLQTNVLLKLILLVWSVLDHPKDCLACVERELESGWKKPLCLV